MNINIPPSRAAGFGKGAIGAEIDKENVSTNIVAANEMMVTREQRKRQRMEPIKSSTFLAELSRKSVPVVRRIN